MPRSQNSAVTAEFPDEALFNGALESCARVHGTTIDEVLSRLEQGDRKFHSSFRYGLAKGLGGYLGALGCAFREVYVYGSTMEGLANPASDIDVIVVVRKRRDEILRLLGMLDVAITACYRRLVGLKTNPSSLLDVHIVEDGEEIGRSGHGAVLAGLNTRPVCLWRSPPAQTAGTPVEWGPRLPIRSTASAIGHSRRAASCSSDHTDRTGRDSTHRDGSDCQDSHNALYQGLPCNRPEPQLRDSARKARDAAAFVR